MVYSIFIRVLRRWASDKRLVALAIVSRKEHTESCVLLDDAGSGYQIAIRAAGVFFCPRVTVSEYVPETMTLLHQESFTSSLLTLRRDLNRSLALVDKWMREKGSKRLPQGEEMKLVEKMYARARNA